MKHRVIQPKEFPKPKGYSNGIVISGATLYIAGQVGWDREGNFPASFAEQFAQALDNVLAVVTEAGARAEDVVKMTVYVTDVDLYRAAVAELGPIWRARFERHYPAMALVGVSALVEPKALVEIEAVAAVPAHQ